MYKHLYKQIETVFYEQWELKTCLNIICTLYMDYNIYFLIIVQYKIFININLFIQNIFFK
jgi:hypothetical protein